MPSLFILHIQRQDKSDYVRINVTLRRVHATNVSWKSNEYDMTWVCSFVTLGIQHVMLMCHIFICGLPGSTIFLHITSSSLWFNMKIKMSVDVLTLSFTQGRIKLFGAPRQWKHSRPLFQAVFLSGGGYYPPDWVKYHASQSQDRNNKYFILYIEFCINNKI